MAVPSISPIATLFGKVYTYQGEPITADWVGFLGQSGAAIVLIMVFSFLVNLILARITPLKYVFLKTFVLETGDDRELTPFKFTLDSNDAWCHDVSALADVGDGAHVNDYGG